MSDYQLSLAIGKEGQNARLAARLTGWRIDIKSETQLAEEEAGYGGEEWAEGEWVQNEAGEMVWQPAEGGEAVSATQWSAGAEGAEGTDGAEGAAGVPVAPTRRKHGDAEPTGGVGAERAARGRAGRPAPCGWPGRIRHSPDSDLHRVPADSVRRTSWCGWCVSLTAKLAVGRDATGPGGVAVSGPRPRVWRWPRKRSAFPGPPPSGRAPDRSSGCDRTPGPPVGRWIGLGGPVL